MSEEFKGKCTVIVESKDMTTRQLEKVLHEEIDHMREFGFSDLCETEFFVVPSDEVPYG